MVDACGDGLLVADIHHQAGYVGVDGDSGGGGVDALLGAAGQDDMGSGFG